MYPTKTYTSLAIIGNGFDLTHGYHTSYKNFTDCIGEDSLQNYRAYVDAYGTRSPWNAFEKCVEELSYAFYQYELADADFNDTTIIPFNNAFGKLKKKLMDYLRREQKRIPLEKKPTIEKYLGRSTLAFTFNYTNLAECYLDSVFYIHGSLKEEDIVLGFDPKSALCMASFDTIQWFKGFCRERLDFKRYLRTQRNLSQTDPLYIQLCQEYGQIQRTRNSGKGLEDEDIANLKHANLLRNYLAHEVEQGAIDQSKRYFHDITSVVVLGHSLQSDENYLNELFQHLTNLKTVILFTFPGDDSIQDKEKFLSLYCKNIRLEWYDSIQP